MIELVYMYFIDRKRENKRQNKLNSFVEKKTQDAKEEKKISRFFLRGTFRAIFFLPGLLR
jgi:hypothetical protein